MHSSRMRTGRSLTVCWSLLPKGSAPWGGVSARGGLLPGGSAPEGVCSGGDGGLSAPGGTESQTRVKT